MTSVHTFSLPILHAVPGYLPGRCWLFPTLSSQQLWATPRLLCALWSSPSPSLISPRPPAFPCLCYPTQWQGCWCTANFFLFVYRRCASIDWLDWLLRKNYWPLSLLFYAPFPSLVDLQPPCRSYFFQTTSAHLNCMSCCAGCCGCRMRHVLLTHSRFLSWGCSHLISHWGMLRLSSRRLEGYVPLLTFCST